MPAPTSRRPRAASGNDGPREEQQGGGAQAETGDRGSLVHAGIFEQDPLTRLYDMGPTLMRLGVPALGRNRIIQRGMSRLQALSDSTGLAAHIVVRGSHGPVIVRWESRNLFQSVDPGLGSTLSLLDSASGRIYLAHSPSVMTHDLLKDELRLAKLSKRNEGCENARFRNAELARIRKEGGAMLDWPYRPSLCAVGAPVMNWQGGIEFVVTLVGLEHQKYILDPSSDAQTALRAFVAEAAILPAETGLPPKGGS